MEKAESSSSKTPIDTKAEEQVSHRQYSITTRRGHGQAGVPIPLLSNHFAVSTQVPKEKVFSQYSVKFTREDGVAIDGKGFGRKLIEKVRQTYSTFLGHRPLAYDGEKTLYIAGELEKNYEFSVVLEDTFAKRESDIPETNSGKRSKHTLRSKNYKVNLHFAAKIPLKTIFPAASGAVVDNRDGNAQDALRVLDTVLRQQAAKKACCLLVRQSFFVDNSMKRCEIGGGVNSIQGLHSSFRLTERGLSLNVDVSTTTILQPGNLINFLKANQNVGDNHLQRIDWQMAKRMLKNMRIKASHTNREYRITGLSDRPCNQLMFHMQREGRDISVLDYFKNHNYYKDGSDGGFDLRYSRDLPCVDVGKPNRPIYLPLELCVLVSPQRYTKALSGPQRASLVGNSKQKPSEKIRTLQNEMVTNRFDEDPFLVACGISIEKYLTQVRGRVLEAPRLKFGNDERLTPRGGGWNLHNQRILYPIYIELWVVVSFSPQWDPSFIGRELANHGNRKGMNLMRIKRYTFREDSRFSEESASVRVDKMFDKLKATVPARPDFILCVLPERKNSDIYGPWKKKCLTKEGVVTQCISPPTRVNEQYLTNVLLKINAKLGGINWQLEMEAPCVIPRINRIPTLILGMDVSRGSTVADTPSIAAVVGSRCWPYISRYRAELRTQSSMQDMIECLYMPLTVNNNKAGEDNEEKKEDMGIMRELFKEFYLSSDGRKPKQIIIFRDGVSESQFNQILNIEVDQIIKAYQHLDDSENVPKFTVIVAQKNHHTKLFQSRYQNEYNVPPGTIVDTGIVHPTNYDFYMCAHAGRMGTSRPAHYHVLLNEIGFSPDDLQSLIHSLSYVYQRSTNAVSIVAPVRYAHLAAAQVRQFTKSEDLTDQAIHLEENVKNTMFFC